MGFVVYQRYIMIKKIYPFKIPQSYAQSIPYAISPPWPSRIPAPRPGPGTCLKRTSVGPRGVAMNSESCRARGSYERTRTFLKRGHHLLGSRGIPYRINSNIVKCRAHIPVCTAQGGGGSFRHRKPIGKVRCYE